MEYLIAKNHKSWIYFANKFRVQKVLCGEGSALLWAPPAARSRWVPAFFTVVFKQNQEEFQLFIFANNGEFPRNLFFGIPFIFRKPLVHVHCWITFQHVIKNLDFKSSKLDI
jgi:hypothetical protein